MTNQRVNFSDAGQQGVSLRTLPPLSLYIHIPWCARKCPYCDFNSHELRGAPAPLGEVGSSLPPELEQHYVAALARDLELALPLIWGRRVYSIFFGGGTPSLLSGEGVAGILRNVRNLLPLDLNTEITLEANPGTVEISRFAAYREAGVNRLSLGIQSFEDAQLRALGRIHDGVEARRAIDTAQAHFDNLNLDLMYALPAQSTADAMHDLETALSYAPQHVSCYHLTLEPNTLFYSNPPPLPEEDASAEMQAQIEKTLATRGYAHYETSAFALPGRQSRHNLNYWQFGDYLGIGAGAHSKLSFPDRVLRQARYKQPRAYLEQVMLGEPVQTTQQVEARELAFEFMMNALRLTDGFDTALFEERTGLSWTSLRKELGEAERRGLLTCQMKEGINSLTGQPAIKQHVAPTELGRRFLNDLLQVFLPG